MDLGQGSWYPTTKPGTHAVSLLLVPQISLIPIPPFVSLGFVCISMDKQKTPKQVHNAQHKAGWDWDTAAGLAQGPMGPGRRG